jgi:hypothetical protein
MRGAGAFEAPVELVDGLGKRVPCNDLFEKGESRIAFWGVWEISDWSITAAAT